MSVMQQGEASLYSPCSASRLSSGLSIPGLALVEPCQAATQHFLQSHRPFVLFQEIGDRLIHQVLEGLAVVPGEPRECIEARGTDMDHLAHACLPGARLAQLKSGGRKVVLWTLESLEQLTPI